jgi:hypothetical protein
VRAMVLKCEHGRASAGILGRSCSHGPRGRRAPPERSTHQCVGYWPMAIVTLASVVIPPNTIWKGTLFPAGTLGIVTLS